MEEVMIMNNLTNEFMQNMVQSNEQASKPESVYVVHVDVAEILRVTVEAMVTGYNLGLMERNMRRDKGDNV